MTTAVVATGSQILMGLRRELAYNRPDASVAYVFPQPILPIDLNLMRQEHESGEASPSGFLTKGIPGPISGPASIGFPFGPTYVLEILEHIFGSGTKTNPDGAYQYDWEPDPDGVITSFSSYFAKGTVEQEILYGIMFGGVQFDIGDNKEVTGRATGHISHGVSKFGPVVPDAGNTGTYTKGPFLRGVPLDASAGSVFAKITSVSPLQFKCEQGSSPTYPGSAHNVLTDLNGDGDWQNLQGGYSSPPTDRDLGIWGENYDPLDIIFPGDSTELAKLALNDVFEFPTSWSNPSHTYLTGPRFTSAHLSLYYRDQGAGTWIAVPRPMLVSFGFNWPLTPVRGDGSRYIQALERDSKITPTVTLNWDLFSSLFRDYNEKHERMEFLIEFLGAQIGTTYTNRNRIRFEYPALNVQKLERKIGGPGAVKETVTLVAEEDDSGNAPVTGIVNTTRDYTLAT